MKDFIKVTVYSFNSECILRKECIESVFVNDDGITHIYCAGQVYRVAEDFDTVIAQLKDD